MGLDPDPEGVQRLEVLVQILETDGVSHGLLGPNEAERVLERHVLESCALLPFIDSASHGLIDVGSGGGLPGLPLACLGATGVTLIDSQKRRVRFLSTTVDRLGMEVDVRHGRAEDLARTDLRESAGTVVARALAEPATALELTIPFVKIGGRLLLLGTPPDHVSSRGSAPKAGTGATPASGTSLDATDALAKVAAELGGGIPSWAPLALPGNSESRWVLVVPKLSPTAEDYPRRAGVPKRRPLG